jgi:AcrR family transcriptional regulator
MRPERVETITEPPESAARGDQPVRAGRPTRDDLERRKVEILRAATELFLRKGFAETTIKDISREARVATRTIYQHFGDKEGIFRNITISSELGNVFPPPPIDTGRSLRDNVMQIAQYAMDVAFRPSAMDMLRLIVRESLRYPEMVARVFELTYEQFRSNIKWQFDRLVAAGLMRDDDTEASAAIFIDLILGASAMYVATGWRAPEAYVTEKVDLLIAGRWGGGEPR